MSDEAALRDRIAAVSVSQVGDRFVLGRADLRRYVAVPEPGAVFVRALQGGDSIAEATRRASAVAGELVDGVGFLAGLTSAGLVREATRPAAPDAPRAIDWIARALFGRIAWIGYAVAALAAAVMLVVRADLRPDSDDVWFLADPMVSVLAYVPVGILLGASHEGWHWLAGRAVGVSGRFRVSHRGVYLVFETDLSQLVTLPRRRRYGPFLAGMAFDVTVLAAALGIRLSYREDLLEIPAVLDRFLGVVVLYQVLGIVWQWSAIPLRSDGYAIVANALRCNNLYRVTRLTLRDYLFGLDGERHAELVAASERDRRVARWFAPVHIAGYLAMAGVFLSVAVPYLIAVVGWAAANVYSLAVGTWPFWVSLGVCAYLFAVYALPPVLAVRERRLHRKGQLR
ncbi:MAG TPA: hypothetical protein VM677_06880 [Actinokineospora sp.]|nr:hypothetical protein [Actinokineospora sp.]